MDIVDFEDWMIGRGLRPNTVAQRVAFAAARQREWTTWDVPPSTIAAFIQQHDGWTALTYYTHLRSIYRWQIETGQLRTNPTDPVRRPPTPVPDPDPLDRDQVDAVFDGVTGHLRTWMLLALLAGLRVHEVAKFRGEEITQRRIALVGKGGRVDPVPTHPDLWALVGQYPARGYWFPSPVNEGKPYSVVQVSARVAQRFRQVGIADGSIHRLRATYGTELLRKGVNTRAIQKLMRHRSLETTEHYLGVHDDELAAAIGLLAA